MDRSPLDSLRVIYLASASGVLLAAGVLFAVRPLPSGDGTVANLLAYASAGLMLASVGAVQVLRARVLSVLRENPDEAGAALRAGQPYRGTYVLLLLPAVLLELPALLAAVGLFFHGPTWLLALPVLSAATMLWAMPTRGSLLRLLNA